MKQAIIDIGSNSMRMCVYEIEGERFQILFKEKNMAGLAGYVKDGVLAEEGIVRACSGLTEFRDILHSLAIEQVSVFATASLRNISNTDEAVAAIDNAVGFRVDVISGEDEALYGYTGVTRELDIKKGVFVDIGGASTEVVYFDQRGPVTADSFQIGSLSLYRACVKKILPDEQALKRMQKQIAQELDAKTLRRLVQVGKHQVYVDTCPINMKYVYSLIASLPASVTSPLLFEPYQSRWPEDIRRGSSIIEQIQQQDKLLFYPFDSVDPFLRLLNEAAERPDVLSIKITIYRLASSSKIAHTLCRAAENGKEVVVLMELRARFDEANNISWSKLLEDAGCQVIYGVEDFKCHSKICLITMRSKGKLRYITQIGTGNYNEKTNAMYTDLSMMTAAQAIGEDGTAFFQNMLVNNLEGSYKQLLVAPKGMKTAICRLMDEEIAKGKDGYICIKANAVTEREVIDKLREASQAGVEVQLIIRGICCLLPGIPLYTENIHVTSIVGRFLEHARIYCFGRGNDTRLYLSSADMMTRNLNRRVEIACPVTDAEIKDQLLWILATQRTDNSKASFLLSDGTYSRKNGRLTGVVNSQERFMEISIHHAVETAPAQTGALQKMRAWLHKRLKK